MLVRPGKANSARPADPASVLPYSVNVGHHKVISDGDARLDEADEANAFVRHVLGEFL
jgi:hypothetical protein